MPQEQPTREEMIQKRKDFVPKLMELNEQVLFGDIWERPGLSKRDRSLITVAALVALYRINELPFHIARAQSPIRDSIGHAEREQASGRCHRSRDPGNTGGESAGVPPGLASRLCDRRRSPPPRVGSGNGLRQKMTRGIPKLILP